MKQAERVERSTKALLDAAAEIIVEPGYEALSIGAVGERSGYSRGLVTAGLPVSDRTSHQRGLRPLQAGQPAVHL